MTEPHRSRDDGSALVMALVFVTVMSLVVLALLAQTTTSLKTTRVARATADKTYAADAGLEEAIERLRLDATICSKDQGGATSMGTVTINDHQVQLACDTVLGESAGAAGWAVVITGTDEDSFDVQGGSEEKIIHGPTYMANLTSDNKDWAVENGALYEGSSASGCDLAQTTPPFSNIKVRPTPPFSYHCTTDGVPAIDHALPTARPTPENAFPPWGGANGCTVFSPGTYSGAAAATFLNLDGDKYFRTGTYYFEDIDEWQVNGDIIGGKADPTESRLITNSPCSSETDSNPGTGVKFIFGGSSSFAAVAERTELFRRVDGDASEGEMGFAIQEAEAVAGKFKASTLSGSQALLSVTGNKTTFTTTGAIYAPSSYLRVFANKTGVVFQGGLIAQQFDLDSSANIGGVLVSSANSPEVRQIVVTAKALGKDGSRTITGTAVLQLYANSGRTFEVESWRVE